MNIYRPVPTQKLIFTIGVLMIAIATSGCTFDDEEPVVIIEDPGSDINDVGHDTERISDVDDDTGEPPADLKADGAPCDNDDQCLGGTCLIGDYWNEGHCTTAGCSTDADCAGDTDEHLCVDHPYEGSICVNACQYDGGDNGDDGDSCRSRYECRPHTSDSAWCGPEIDTTSVISPAYEEQCQQAVGGTVEFDFEISSSATSYFLGMSANNQGTLDLETIDLPDGQQIDFLGENAFQIRATFSQSGMAMLTIPGASSFDEQIQSGTHHLTASTTAGSACLYVIENHPSNDRVDLNVYLLGLEDKDLTFTTAKSHPAFQSALDETSNTLSQVGITLGEVRYFEVPQQIAEDYRVLHQDTDLYWLLAYSQSPGEGLDKALSVNAFYLESFAIPALGLSAGAPGFAAVHGNWSSGLAVSSEHLGTSAQGNDLAGTTLAHEMGHFLGLRHTSEQDGQTFDGVADTPECEDMDTDQIWNCPDWGNLMFPAAYPENRDLTAGQGFVLQSNPLSK